jgi:hypothetical protein
MSFLWELRRNKNNDMLWNYVRTDKATYDAAMRNGLFVVKVLEGNSYKRDVWEITEEGLSFLKKLEAYNYDHYCWSNH